MDIILTPFVWLLRVFYSFCGSYGLALILFAVVVKVIMFPFALKGKRSMIQMNMLSEKMQKLQKQYGKDRDRYNLEVQKLYEREKVNPMSGCLWSFIPMIVLLILYPIIREPIHYMMGVNSPEVLNAIAEAVNWNTVALDMGWIREAAGSFTESNGYYNQLYLASLITPENLAAVQAAAGEVGKELFSINFDFLGFADLSQIPELKFWTIKGGLGLFLLPVISAVSSLLFSLLSMKTNAVNQQSAQSANNASMKSMMIMSPLISLWIGFTLPAALCVYWIANNLLSMLQEVICGRMLKKDYERVAAMKAEQELREKEEEKERKRLAAEERARRLEEEKKNKGKKKKAEKKPAEDDGKISGAVKAASRVGMRQYARGRAYDPYRYSDEGPTPYPGEDRLFPKKGEEALPPLPVEEESALGEDMPGLPPEAAEPEGAAEEAPYAEETEASDEEEKE